MDDLGGRATTASDAPSTIVRRIATAWLDLALACALFGFVAGVVVDAVLWPALFGQGPRWTPAAMRASFPALAAWTFAGFALGALAARFVAAGRRRGASDAAPPVRVRIAIVGGGFAGVSTARALERRYAGDPSVELTLVSDTNALVFTPMLAEVAGGSLEASHIGSPIRTALARTTFVRERVSRIDFERRVVVAKGVEVPYDQLVLALGAVSKYLGLANVERCALDFKTLADAAAVRDRVVEMFERADRLEPSAERRTLLTFVIAGGGFAGAEVAGALNDFARGILLDYPRLSGDELDVVVVHSRDRILPELSASLADYALARMRARGVRFVLGSRVKDATETSVSLDDGATIAAATLVWTAGTGPNPAIRALDVPHDERGAARVDVNLAVDGLPGVWALGDCAAVRDEAGKPYAPTAQNAIREATALAANVAATIEGEPLRPFRFRPLGALCVVGFQTACAELNVPLSSRTLRFSGFFAWLMWRGVYLAKLPGAERRLRVLLDWIVELFFPKDIVQIAEPDA